MCIRDRPEADMIKISDEELAFVTEIEDEMPAIQSLFKGHVEAVIYTQGGNGAAVYLKDGTVLSHPGYKVEVVDTTGAGDAFIGAFISRLLQTDQADIASYIKTHGEAILDFSNYVASRVTTRYGALSSIPVIDDIPDHLK